MITWLGAQLRILFATENVGQMEVKASWRLEVSFIVGFDYHVEIRCLLHITSVHLCVWVALFITTDTINIVCVCLWDVCIATANNDSNNDRPQKKEN